MTNEVLIERIMDWLAGELTPQEEQELKGTLYANPEMHRHALELEDICGKLGRRDPEEFDDSSVLKRVYQRVLQAQGLGQLSDDDLDKAAGGVLEYDPSEKRTDSGQKNRAYNPGIYGSGRAVNPVNLNSRKEATMSIESSRAFIEKVKSDEELAKKVNEAEGFEPTLKIAKAHGYEFSKEDAEQVQQELSEEDLYSVAGGVGCLTYSGSLGVI